jgi:hypothetical protein
MRRMLFTFAGGTGHFLPLVPLARAAEQAGHRVAFGGQPGMLSACSNGSLQDEVPPMPVQPASARYGWCAPTASRAADLTRVFRRC